jgi:hypothetical protein
MSKTFFTCPSCYHFVSTVPTLEPYQYQYLAIHMSQTRKWVHCAETNIKRAVIKRDWEINKYTKRKHLYRRTCFLTWKVVGTVVKVISTLRGQLYMLA